MECARPASGHLGCDASLSIVTIQIRTEESLLRCSNSRRNTMVDDHGMMLEDNGSGRDGALATWDAMCRIEQRLRERRL